MKAIETVYKGYKMRSRLEARYAVFFDVLGIEWEYEKEGFDLGKLGYYLPDFWLPNVYDRRLQKGIWVEIKGKEPSGIEDSKCQALTIGTQHSTIIMVGLPSDGLDDFQPENTQWTYGGEHTFWDNAMTFHYCNCGGIKVEFLNDYYTCPVCGKDSCTWGHNKLTIASNAARSARFEHGESPTYETEFGFRVKTDSPKFQMPKFDED